MIAAAFAGILAGMVHALTGPDHLAAVAPLTLSSRRQPWAIGVRWGLGHALGIALVALAVIPLRGLVPLGAVSRSSELLVGASLVAIGLWGLRKAFSRWVHTHRHRHEGEPHVHIHFHPPGEAEKEHSPEHSHTHAALGLGLLHGLAGTSHLFGILPALALPNALTSTCYIAAYGLGNLVAMGAFSGVVGLLSSRIGSPELFSYRAVLAACSLAAVGVGGVWLSS